MRRKQAYLREKEERDLMLAETRKLREEEERRRREEEEKKVEELNEALQVLHGFFHFLFP